MYLTRVRNIRGVPPEFLPGVVEERDRDTVFKLWLLDDTLPDASSSWSPVQELMRRPKGRLWLDQTVGQLVDIYLVDSDVDLAEDFLGEPEDGEAYPQFLDIRGRAIPFAAAIQSLAADFCVPRRQLPALVGFVSSRRSERCVIPLADCRSEGDVKARLGDLVDCLQKASEQVLGRDRTQSIVTGLSKAQLKDEEADRLVALLGRLFRQNEQVTEEPWASLERTVAALVSGWSEWIVDRTITPVSPTVQPSAGGEPFDLVWRIEFDGHRFKHNFVFPSRRVKKTLGEDAYSKKVNESDLRGLTESCFRRLESAHHRLDARRHPVREERVLAELKAHGDRLTDRIVPESLKALFEQNRTEIHSVLLVVDSTSMLIPWELLRLPDGESSTNFLACMVALGRWHDELLHVSPAHSLNVKRILSIEVAEVGDERPPLRSAGRVGDFLESRFKDVSSINLTRPPHPRGREVLELLANERIDLFHFEGHGDHDSSYPISSPLALYDEDLTCGDFDPDSLVGIAEVRPLVFLNACRTGRSAPEITGVGGWPDRWVRELGCGALICPQWSVRDRSAADFATKLYRRLIEDPDTTIGQAIREVRRSMMTDPSTASTALAYLYYGDPNARVRFGSVPAERASVMTGEKSEPSSTPTDTVLSVRSPLADALALVVVKYIGGPTIHSRCFRRIVGSSLKKAFGPDELRVRHRAVSAFCRCLADLRDEDRDRLAALLAESLDLVKERMATTMRDIFDDDRARWMWPLSASRTRDFEAIDWLEVERWLARDHEGRHRRLLTDVGERLLGESNDRSGEVGTILISTWTLATIEILESDSGAEGHPAGDSLCKLWLQALYEASRSFEGVDIETPGDSQNVQALIATRLESFDHGWPGYVLDLDEVKQQCRDQLASAKHRWNHTLAEPVARSGWEQMADVLRGDDLFGREQDIKRLDEMLRLDGGQLDKPIVIAGGGGVGKTTLAQNLGWRLRRDVEFYNLVDEVYFVALGPYCTSANAIGPLKRLAAQMRITPASTDSAERLHERICNSIGERDVLIVDDVWRVEVYRRHFDFGHYPLRTVLTTRSEELAVSLSPHPFLGLRSLDRRASIGLLAAESGINPDRELEPVLSKACERLADLPLALRLGGRFCRLRAGTGSMTQRDALLELSTNLRRTLEAEDDRLRPGWDQSRMVRIVLLLSLKEMTRETQDRSRTLPPLQREHGNLETEHCAVRWDCTVASADDTLNELTHWGLIWREGPGSYGIHDLISDAIELSDP